MRLLPIRTYAGVMLSATAALSTAVPGTAHAQGSTLVVDMATAPANLDPAWTCDLWSIGFLQNFYVRLTQYGERPGPDGTTQIDPGNIEPYLAESWTISADGTVFTFTLGDGWTFPSGAPVDSNAVRYSFERALKMNGCGAYFLLDGFYDPPLIQSIETPDDRTVVITLSQPSATALQLWATPAASIVDPAVVEANGGVEEGRMSEYLASNAAGSGPFLLESYLPNERAVLVANPDYRGTPPSADRIEVNWIGSPATLLLRARTGEADITIGLTKQAAASLRDNPDLRLIANSYPVMQQVLTPNGKPPWDNANVREAAAISIPYEDILQAVAFGWGGLFYGPIPPSMPEHNPDISAPLGYDIERAKQLMAESGIDLPVDVELIHVEGNTIEAQIATILQNAWQEIGINLAIRVVPAAEFQELAQGHRAQTLLRLDGPGVIEAGYLLGYDMVCALAQSFNLSEICIPEADTLLAEARSSNDPQRRAELFDQITSLWRDNHPKIILYEDQQVTVLGKDATNFHFSHMVDMRRWSNQ